MEIENEYIKKIEDNRPFKVPNYRSGDVVEVSYFDSLSEGKLITKKGILVGSRRRKSLSKQFTILVKEGGE